MKEAILNPILSILSAVVSFLIALLASPLVFLWGICICIVMVCVVFYQTYMGIKSVLEDNFLDR